MSCSSLFACYHRNDSNNIWQSFIKKKNSSSNNANFFLWTRNRFSKNKWIRLHAIRIGTINNKKMHQCSMETANRMAYIIQLDTLGNITTSFDAHAHVAKSMFIHSQTGSIFCYFDSVQPAIRENFRIVNWFDIVRMTKRSERIDRGSYFFCTVRQCRHTQQRRQSIEAQIIVIYFTLLRIQNSTILFCLHIYSFAVRSQLVTFLLSNFFLYFSKNNEQMKNVRHIWMIILKPFFGNSFRWKFKVFSKDS